MKENEFDSVIIWSISNEEISSISPVKNEIEEIYWLSFDEIDKKLATMPDVFTTWFNQAYDIAKYTLLPIYS